MFVATFEGNQVFRSTIIYFRFALRDVTEAFLPGTQLFGTISRVECTSSPEEGVSMKRWFLLSLALIAVVVSLLVIRDHVTSAKPLANRSHLVRIPHSAYKYSLCSEAFAFAMASADNPYKTDFTFHDPYRNASDTIIPRFLGFDNQTAIASFSVKIIIDQVATFNEMISHVQTTDGIAVLIPDANNQLQQSHVPQFIISLPEHRGRLAVLDYTCPDQWVWSAIST